MGSLTFPPPLLSILPFTRKHPILDGQGRDGIHGSVVEENLLDVDLPPWTVEKRFTEIAISAYPATF